MVGIGIGGCGGCGCDIECTDCCQEFPSEVVVTVGALSGSGYGAGRGVWTGSVPCGVTVSGDCEPCEQFPFPDDIVLSVATSLSSPTLCFGNIYSACKIAGSPIIDLYEVSCCNALSNGCGMKFVICAWVNYLEKDDRCYISFALIIRGTTNNCTASCIGGAINQSVVYMAEITGKACCDVIELDYVCHNTQLLDGTPTTDICSNLPATVTVTPVCA